MPPNRWHFFYLWRLVVERTHSHKRVRSVGEFETLPRRFSGRNLVDEADSPLLPPCRWHFFYSMATCGRKDSLTQANAKCGGVRNTASSFLGGKPSGRGRFSHLPPWRDTLYRISRSQIRLWRMKSTYGGWNRFAVQSCFAGLSSNGFDFIQGFNLGFHLSRAKISSWFNHDFIYPTEKERTFRFSRFVLSFCL